MLLKIHEDMQEQKKEIKEMEEKILNNMNDKFSAVENKYNNLEKILNKQEIRIDGLEKHIRKRNIMIFGVEETENSYVDLENIILQIINTVIGIPLLRAEIETVRRLGRNDGKTRPIVLTLTTTGKKILLLKGKKKLEKTNYYIKEDFPPKVLEKRKELQPELQKARDEGKRAIIKYDKLIITENKNKNSTNTYQNKNKRNMSRSPENIQREPTNKTTPPLFQKAKKSKTGIKDYMSPKVITE